MEFVLATNNRNKLEELQRMLGDTGHTFLTLGDVGVTSEPEEDGKTFKDNALKKAAAACAISGKPAIADDSGLEVDALGGAPGVLSARFAGEPPDDAANNKRLLGYLTRTPYAQRGAHFVCVVAAVLPDGAQLVAEGKLDGVIGFAPSGDNGFGYDPLFYVNGRSLADMNAEEKDAISHRAVALRRFKQELPGFLAAQAQGEQDPAPVQEAAPEPAPEPERAEEWAGENVQVDETPESPEAAEETGAADA